MEPEMPALSNSRLNFHPLPEEFHEIKTEFCEKSSVNYSEIKVHCSSNIQKKNKSRILKTKVSPWCFAAMIFAFLYLIALVVAAIMTAKVHCLESILKAQEINKQNEAAYCKVI